MINKYAGRCGSCLNIVEAGEGIYEYGNVYCQELTEREGLTDRNWPMCDAAYALELKGEPARAAVKQDWLNRNRMQHDKMQEIKLNLKAQGLCVRCGGAGRSDMWKDTGYVCYQCEGTGKAKAGA